MSNMPDKINYEYKIKNGDTFSGIIHSMFGHSPNNPQYTEIVQHVLALNPQISNPDRIKAGDMLLLGVYPGVSQPKLFAGNIIKPNMMTPNSVKPPTFISQSIPAHDADNFWALSWLEHNANYLLLNYSWRYRSRLRRKFA